MGPGHVVKKTYLVEQLHASVVKYARLTLYAGIVGILSANGDHGSVKHWWLAYALKGSSMYDRVGGVKTSPVIVQILFKWICVCKLTHTVGLFWEEKRLFFFITL